MSVVGLDFGNANNVVALARRKGIDVVLNTESKRETPSMVNFGVKQVRPRARRPPPRGAGVFFHQISNRRERAAFHGLHRARASRDIARRSTARRANRRGVARNPRRAASLLAPTALPRSRLAALLVSPPRARQTPRPPPEPTEPI